MYAALLGHKVKTLAPSFGLAQPSTRHLESRSARGSSLSVCSNKVKTIIFFSFFNFKGQHCGTVG